MYSFTGGDDGARPYAGLVQDSDGNFYGTTDYGGTYYYYGTVFKISADGTLTSLYSFGSVHDTNGYSLDGVRPNGLVQGSDGNFYGTTYVGGQGGNGIVFRLTVVPEPPQLTINPQTSGGSRKFNFLSLVKLFAVGRSG